MLSNPKFLVVRFTHGSGGKFLCTILQTSEKIDHWNQQIEAAKHHTELFYSLSLSYARQSFPQDHKFHPKCEPMVPYNTDLYSSSYPRGNNVTVEELLDHARTIKDTRLLDALNQSKTVNIIMNKAQLPKFCHGANVVTISTETDFELNWLHHTLWSKHFLETKDQIFYLPDHPDFCNPKSLNYIKKYQNPCVFPISQKQLLIHDKIINNPTCHEYKDHENFDVIDATNKVNNIFVPLKNLLEFEALFDSVQEIFQKFDLGDPDRVLIKDLHDIWIQQQISSDLCVSIVDSARTEQSQTASLEAKS